MAYRWITYPVMGLTGLGARKCLNGEVSNIFYDMAHALQNHLKSYLLRRNVFRIDPISFGNNPLNVALTLEKKIASR